MPVSKKNRMMGMKFGHLTLLQYARPGGQGVGSIWFARCDCGNVREFKLRDIRHGHTKTCGTCQFHHELVRKRHTPSPGPQYDFRRRMAREIRRAVLDKHTFDITQAEFKRITSRTCSFCPETKGLGVQRVSRGGGYTLENVVPICLECRRRLAGMVVSEALVFYGTVLTRSGFTVTDSSLHSTG